MPEASAETLRRARPVNALGGDPRKDHLFGPDKRSLCGSWMYGGGREVEPGDIDPEELCQRCARRAEATDV